MMATTIQWADLLHILMSRLKKFFIVWTEGGDFVRWATWFIKKHYHEAVLKCE